MSLSTNLSLSRRSHQELLQEVEALLTGRWITDLANVSALLMGGFPDINWVGFYLTDAKDSQTLWLGPFQGLPACTMIPFGKGVCGTAAMTKKSQLVHNVHQFPGHIVCDARSQSEVVIPIILNNQVVGVLDIDSASAGRFNESDVVFFENVVKTLLKQTKPQ